MEAVRQEETLSPATKRPTILELAQATVKARRDNTFAKAVLSAAREAWEAENAVILQIEADAKFRLQTLEAELRAAVLADYKLTGNKKPGPGCEVAVGKNYSWLNADAMTWAQDNAPVLIKRVLDEKGFERFCKDDDLRPTFVTVSDKETVRIATDLDGALAGVPA